ncbi:hypothetical protein D3C87_1889310 [compost metagenome]
MKAALAEMVVVAAAVETAVPKHLAAKIMVCREKPDQKVSVANQVPSVPVVSCRITA